MGKPKIIYTHVGLSSFVKKDIKILSESFDLIIFHFDLTIKKKLPFIFLKQFFFLLRNSLKTRAFVVQFAGYQSYLPTLISYLFHKKSILILGGTDTVSFPSIQYGCFYNKYLKHFTSRSLKLANLLLPVSENLIECQYTYTNDDYPKQGYKFHVPEIKTKSLVIYNGYDSEKWMTNEQVEEFSFLTIGADLGSRFGKKLKGIDMILSISKEFPKYKFYIIGGDRLNEELPENVIPIGNMPHDELPSFIANKQFYLQLSMSEGFPNALCEAMLSGCTPIVSNVGAMPMIIGDTGYVLRKKNIELLSKIIQKAISEYTTSDRVLNRTQIETNFTIKRRKTELTSAILNLIRTNSN